MASTGARPSPRDGAFRPAHADPLDRGWRAGAEGAALTTIDLGPLDVSEAGHLAEEFEGLDATLISACVERAGGNPLFLEQLLRSANGTTSLVSF